MKKVKDVRNKFAFFVVNIFLLIQFTCAIDETAKLVVAGSNCMVTEPLYNHTFNFTSLTSDLAHVIEQPGYTINFNICSKLAKPCNGTTGVSACLTKKIGDKTVETILGQNESQLNLFDGRLHFNFTGQKCRDQENYTLHVIMHCDYEHESGELSIIPTTSDACAYYAFWSTKLACLSQPIVNTEKCKVKTPKGDIFNLMPLSRTHYKLSSRKNDSYFLLNACNPVLYGHEAMCPADSYICLVNDNETNPSLRYKNFGSLDKINYNLDGRENVVLTYTSNEVCNETKNWTSSITFACKRDVGVSEPIYLNGAGCEHKFFWETDLTCPEPDACIAVDKKNGFRYDLTSLAEKPYTVKQGDKSYTFGVCQDAKDPCLDKSGICQQSKQNTISMGLSSTELLFNDTGAPYLIYKDGANCGKLNKRWTTKIEFICTSVDDPHREPKIIEDTDCRVIIHFPTELACPDEVTKCRVTDSNNEMIDLTPLSKAHRNYKADVTKNLNSTQTEYHINVCRSLVPEYGLGCPGGSAACLGTREPNATLENELGLGFFDVSLTLVNTENGEVPQLRYLRGSPCPKDPLIELSSVIEFSCNPKSGLGNPLLTEIVDDCQYFFKWSTNIICPKHRCKFNSTSCGILNEQLNMEFDLKKIENNGVITVNHLLKPFNINLCEMSNLVAETDYKRSMVYVYFVTKLPTNNENVDIELNIICKSERNLNINLNTTNSLQMDLETPLICPFLGIELDVPPKPKPNDTDHNAESHVDPKSSGVSTIGIIFITLVACSAVGSLIYVFRDPEKRERVLSLFSRRNVPVQYTRVRANEEANLLLPQSGSLSDSDEELLI